MKKLILVVLPLMFAVPASADEVAAPAAPAASWLDGKGIVSTDDLLASLGAKVTPEQRAEVEKALARRNEAVSNANAGLSATLKKVLAADDNKMASDAKDAQRLDRIRRLQPSRYQEILKQQQAGKEKK